MTTLEIVLSAIIILLLVVVVSFVRWLMNFRPF